MSNTVTVVDIATYMPVATVPVGLIPLDVAITPDGAFAYVVNRVSDNVSVVATATNAVVSTVVVGDDPRAVAITPDGVFAYVANSSSNSVSVIATATNTVVASVSVGTSPRAVAIGTPVIAVNIDITPGSQVNPVNLRSDGRLPVAILSTAGFNALADADRTSLTFGRTGGEPSLASCSAIPEDVNGDGLLDLICPFQTQQTGFQAGNSEGILKGRTAGGRSFEGKDAVRIDG